MKARKVKGLDPEGAFADNLERIIGVRRAELRGFATAATDPAEMTALHDMRIAAKRLRYVLELAEPCFGKAARKDVRRARELQDLLGEIHDCDVMLPLVQRHADRLRAEDAAAVAAAADGAGDLDPAAAARAPHRAAYRGLESLATYLRARREVLYGRFLDRWRKMDGVEWEVAP